MNPLQLKLTEKKTRAMNTPKSKDESELTELIEDLVFKSMGGEYVLHGTKEGLKRRIKDYALAKQIDELEMINRKYGRNVSLDIKDDFGNVYTEESRSFISRYEVQERIAELRKQQEGDK